MQRPGKDAQRGHRLCQGPEGCAWGCWEGHGASNPGGGQGRCQEPLGGFVFPGVRPEDRMLWWVGGPSLWPQCWG